MHSITLTIPSFWNRDVLVAQYYATALLWYVLFSLLVVANLEQLATPLFLPLAAYCYFALLTRPLDYSAYPLVILAIGPSEFYMYVGPVILLFRALIDRQVSIPNRIESLLFLAFAYIACCSAILSWLFVEFRPLQTLFWAVTFSLPLTLVFLRFHFGHSSDFPKFALLAISGQAIPLFAQISNYLEIGHADVFGGTWRDADLVGFWGAVLCLGTLYAFISGAVGKRFLLFSLVGFVMVSIASARAYAGSVFLIGALFLLFSARGMIAKSIKGELWSILLLLIALITISLAALQGYENKDRLTSWLNLQANLSQKVIFLDRVFNKMDYYGYSDAIGAGPGMVGSRAANSVSPSVLAKEANRLPAFLMGAPKPTQEIMQGLYSHELLATIRWMSATLVFPFSGIGAVKAELGYLGLIVIVSALLLRYLLFASNPASSPYASLTITIASVAGLATIPLALFDTVWEMPAITLIIGALVMATNHKVKI